MQPVGPFPFWEVLIVYFLQGIAAAMAILMPEIVRPLGPVYLLFMVAAPFLAVILAWSCGGRAVRVLTSFLIGALFSAIMMIALFGPVIARQGGIMVSPG